MAGVGSAAVVDAPPLLPPPNGLLNSAVVIDVTDERFEAGQAIAPESTASLIVFNACDNLTNSDIVGSVSDVVTTAGSTTITSATAKFTLDDVGKTVTSTTVGNQVFADGATTNTSSTLTSATAGFTADDVGKTISGAGIPGSTTISSVTNSTTVVMSANATATATGVSITISNRKAIVTAATIATWVSTTQVTLSAPAKITATGVSFTITGRRDGPNRSDPLTFIPFIVQAKDTCFSRGFTKNDYEGRARRALAAQETIGVEREFWLGTADSTNRHLQDSSNTVVLRSGSALGMRTALDVLVQAIADLGLGLGMIHARPGLVAGWTYLNMLRWTNNKLYTINGNLVVPGYGYPGTGPAGQAVSTTSEWAYVTEAVTVKRGPIYVLGGGPPSAENLNRDRNLVTTRASRAYSVQFNAVAVAAAQVDPTSTS